nr:hypothetical protein [uncultured Lacibacter sp.]
MKKVTLFLLLATSLSAVMVGCKKDLLDVPNENDPDFLKVYAKGEDVENVAAGLFNTLYNGEHAYNGIQMMLAVAADNVTCSHGNAGMWHMSSEPRDLAWDNSPSYSNRAHTKTTFDGMYSAIATANNVIKAVNGGVEIGTGGAGNNRALAVARFIQGVSYGNLALIYDKAHVVDEAKTVEGVIGTAIPYKEVAAAAVAYLDKAIELSNSSFTIPSSWFGSGADISSADFKKMCNTMAARILSYTPRNQTDLAAVNWAKVKTYADAGITADWNVINDAYATWYDEAGDYLTFPGWGKTDMYVVNMMDPTQPQHWTNSASFPHPPPSVAPIDQRLNTDFEFTASNNFRPDRGYFNYSNYRNKRYDALYVAGIGPKPQVLKAENDLLKAEARAYTGDLAGAAAIINAGTRVTRGNMAPVGAVLADIVKAIHHERHVELYTTGVGLQWFEMRKRNLLQKGTPLHMPLPAGILEVLRLTPPFYTFGTVAKADGTGTSNAGWR